MMSMRIKPIPPTMRRVCLFLVTKPPSFWAMVPPPFFAAEAAVWDALPAAWAAPVPARWAAAYCFCRRFFCHSRFRLFPDRCRGSRCFFFYYFFRYYRSGVGCRFFCNDCWLRFFFHHRSRFGSRRRLRFRFRFGL